MNQNNNIKITTSASVIRELARNKMRGNWDKLIVVFLVYELITSFLIMVFDYFLPLNPYNGSFGGMDYSLGSDMQNAFQNGFGDSSILSIIYGMVVLGPMSLGMSYYVLKFLREKDTNISNIFYGFSKFFQAIGVYLLMAVFTAIPMIICLLFMLVILGLAIAVLGVETLGIIIVLLGFFVAMGFVIYISLGLVMSFFCYADNPNQSIMDALKSSWKLMNGNRVQYFGLSFSFIGWIFLSFIPTLIVAIIGLPGFIGALAIYIAGLTLVIVNAYMNVSLGIFYRMLTGKIVPRESYPSYGNNQQQAPGNNNFNNNQYNQSNGYGQNGQYPQNNGFGQGGQPQQGNSYNQNGQYPQNNGFGQGGQPQQGNSYNQNGQYPQNNSFGQGEQTQGNNGYNQDVNSSRAIEHPNSSPQNDDFHNFNGGNGPTNTF